MLIYENEISKIGKFVQKFSDENIMLFFSEETVMTEIKAYSYMIKKSEVKGNIAVGQTVKFGEKDYCHYKITALGKIAQKNLEELGHVTFKFNGAKEAELPGTIYLEAKKLPKLEVNDIFSIIS